VSRVFSSRWAASPFVFSRNLLYIGFVTALPPI